MSPRKRVGVLISGRGSNLGALIEACAKSDYPAEIVAVISNRPGAAGLDKARAAGLPALTVDHRKYSSRSAFEAELEKALTAHNVELLCNAGFMRLLTEEFVERWRDRQLNIHPSLLPDFKGLHTHERVLEAGCTVSGCAVHFVRSEMDSGPIIAQSTVPVLPGDTADTLADRVLAAEHRLYPHALALVASGQARVEGDIVLINGLAARDSPLFTPPAQP